jgi:CHAD domain-containing protein
MTKCNTIEMFTKKRQEEIIEKLRQHAAGHLKKISESDDQDAIHHFRISVKKLKAIGMVIEPSRNRIFFPSLKQGFKQTGTIRDMHNVNQIAEDHQLLTPQIRRKHQQLIDSCYRDVSVHVKKYRMGLLKTCKSLSKKIHPISTDKLKEYFRKRLARLAADLARHDTQEIHSCRKQIKDLLHLYQALPEGLQKQLNIQSDYLDELQERIGEWHDLSLVTPLLKKIRSREKSQVIASELKNLKKSISKISEHFLHKVIADRISQ